MPSITFLDGSGDTTISWDDSVDQEMVAAIDRLMKRGYVFFIVDRLHDNKVTVRREVTKLDQLGKRSVVVTDDALAEMFDQGRIKAANGTRSSTVATVGMATTAAEAASADTVAVPRMQGG